MYKTKFSFLLLALASLTFGSCSTHDELPLEETDKASKQSLHQDVFLSAAGCVKGQLIVKLKQELPTAEVAGQTGIVQLNSMSVVEPLSVALHNVDAHSMRRLFPPAGEFEERTRKEGMHLWYIVDFNPQIELTTARRKFTALDQVETVEFAPEIIPMGVSEHTASTSKMFIPEFQKRDDKLPFNDPLLKKQWHYNNTGKSLGFAEEEGADINLFKAWNITTGKPNVIVCVVDGGIDINHPDLKDNLWVNEKERTGVKGEDDDNNGFVDDVHGFCFVAGTADLLPDSESHGNHVAGTVAAKNDNNIGVCGVAGGDGKADTGVRLMSAAIFRAGALSIGNNAAAIKYGADNGAVISQNSWAYTKAANPSVMPGFLKEAIEYFNKYAGCDKAGNQRPDSPMKGGVVFFAAGNESSEYNLYPSCYEGVVAVAAMAPDYKKASYSNWGSWVDIVAPGGDQLNSVRHGVLSTTTYGYVKKPDIFVEDGTHQYSYYHGTSMACPHASGVAALVVSKFGGKGFTRDMLLERIFASVMPVNVDEINPRYAGKMGKGYIDAYAALTLQNNKKHPEKPVMDKEKSHEKDFTSITVHWTVPKDEDDTTPNSYILYYSDKELTKENYKQGRLAWSGSGVINGLGKKVGDEMNCKVQGLQPNTPYYFALVAHDRWGNASEVALMTANTKKNNPAVIANVPASPGIVLMDINGTASYELEVKETDGHTWSYELSGTVQGISHRKTEKGIMIMIRPALEQGNYSFTVELKDELGEKSHFEIPFKVIKVTAPELKKAYTGRVLGVKNAPVQINLGEYYEPQELLTLTCTANSTDPAVASVKVDKQTNRLTIQGHKAGQTTILVEATNGHKKRNDAFEVLVTEDMAKAVYAVWPLPMRSDLNVWVNPSHRAVRVTLRALNGHLALDEKVTPDASGLARLEVKKVAPGSYRMRVEAGNQSYEEVVLKR